MGTKQPIAALLGLLLAILFTPAIATSHTTPAQQAGTWKEITWHGVVVSYDSSAFVFSPSQPRDAIGGMLARLQESPDPCPPQGADCSPRDTWVRALPRRGLDLQTWATRSARLLQLDAASLTDIVIGGRQALRYWMPTDGIGYDTLVYLVPVGSNVVVVQGFWQHHEGDLRQFRLDGMVGAYLRFPERKDARLVAGEEAMTRPTGAVDLWTQAVGGTRVVERPRLYGGTYVTILALRQRAIQVRTSEGVTGWIHAPAATALRTTIAVEGPSRRFHNAGMVQAIHRNGIPLRAEPRSTSRALVAKLEPNQEARLLGVRGDWARVLLVPEFKVGWARWHYDGTEYLRPIGS